jgi:hypothetical protein
MSEPTPDLDERLARLAARKTISPDAPTRSRRRHPAAAARILSLGLSSSAFFSIIGAFGEQSATHTSNAAGARVSLPTASPAPVRTTVVEKVVHHVLYVDRYGRPIPAPTVSAAGAALPNANRATSGSGQSRSAAPVWNNHPSGTPAAVAPTPTLGGASSAPGPAPATPAVTPYPTPAPAPTPPPQPVVTTPPPPPPPPACSGTQCP